MLGFITQEYNWIQSAVAFCLPEANVSICHSPSLKRHYSRRVRRGATRYDLPYPLSEKPFRLEDVQEHHLLIAYRGQDTTIPLKRDQFETLYQRVSDSPQDFDLDRPPADAEPYATILSIHPRFEVDQRQEC